jgi:hypothetical protein
MNPIKFAVKFKPPRLCLIYELNHEELFHEFPISQDDLERSTKEVYQGLKMMNPGYLEAIEPEQIYGLIEKIKKGCAKNESKVKQPNNLLERETQNKGKGGATAVSAPGKKVSSVDKLGIGDSEESSGEVNVDFNAVEKSFQNESDSDF